MPAKKKAKAKPKTKRKTKSKSKKKTSAKKRTKTVSRSSTPPTPTTTAPDPFDPAKLESEWSDKLRDEYSWAMVDPTTNEEPVRPSNWMSQAGIQCVRRIYYERVAQSKKEPFPDVALARMREGKRHEHAAISDLMQLGYGWEQGQGRCYIHDLELSGKREGYLSRGDDKILCEIKSMENQGWQRYATIADLLESKWYSGYPYQLNAYMVADNQTQALFIIRNRSTGQHRYIPFEYDAELWHDTRVRLKKANRAVAEMQPPDMIGNEKRGHPEHCLDCPFRRHCSPDILSNTPGVRLMAEGVKVAEQKLDRLQTIGGYVAEQKKLNDWKKETFRGIDCVVVGRFIVTGKETKDKHWRTTVADLNVANE